MHVSALLLVTSDKLQVTSKNEARFRSGPPVAAWGKLGRDSLNQALVRSVDLRQGIDYPGIRFLLQTNDIRNRHPPAALGSRVTVSMLPCPKVSPPVGSSCSLIRKRKVLSPISITSPSESVTESIFF